MWCLGRYLPILVGDKIPGEHAHWGHYLLHLSIMDEVFAPICCEDRLDYLRMLIEDFLVEFKELYDRPLTPKMHYLVHYSNLDQMVRYMYIIMIIMFQIENTLSTKIHLA